jgi:hypothetical protein
MTGKYCRCLLLIGADRGIQAPTTDIVGKSFKCGGIPEEQGVGGDHETCIAVRGKTFDLGQKITMSGMYDLVPASLETFPEHREHCSTFGSKRRIVGYGVFSEQNPHS